MASVNITALKAYFNAGDEPTEANFVDVFDSLLSIHADDDTTVAGDTTFSGASSFSGGHKNTVVLNGGTTVTLTAANAGATCIYDTAGASNFTLPAPALGIRFTFISTIIATADHVLQCPTDGHGFLGGVTITSTSAGNSDAFATATDGSDDFLTMNATTTGGAAAGSWIHCAAILGTSAAKTWAIAGILHGSATLATPFAATQI